MKRAVALAILLTKVQIKHEQQWLEPQLLLHFYMNVNEICQNIVSAITFELLTSDSDVLKEVKVAMRPISYPIPRF